MIKLLRYYRWRLVQRVFWRLSSNPKTRWMADRIRDRHYRLLHDYPYRT